LLLFETPFFYEDSQRLDKLWAYLLSRGYMKSDFAMAATVQCLPVNSKKKGREYRVSSPAKTHREACREHLLAFIKELKPKKMIVFGNIAMEEVTGEFDGITKKHCTIVRPKIADMVIPTVLSTTPSLIKLEELDNVLELFGNIPIDK